MGICFSNTTTPDHGNLSVPPTPPMQSVQTSNLKRFSYLDIVKATKKFRGDDSAFYQSLRGYIDEQSVKASSGPGSRVTIVVKISYSTDISQDEWLAEVEHLGRISHPNIVGLIGYCCEGAYRWYLVYEFVRRGSLDNHLFRRGKSLTWSLRMKIVLGAAKALAFLHSDNVKVVYRNFRASKVLLDLDYNAKLSDLRILKNAGSRDKFFSSDYLAPEYAATGHLTPGLDVFSFGLVLLEVLSGRKAVPYGPLANVKEWDKLRVLPDKRRVVRHLLDDNLEGQYTLDAALAIANLALRCVAKDPRSRPGMAKVVEELEAVQENASSSRS